MHSKLFRSGFPRKFGAILLLSLLLASFMTACGDPTATTQSAATNNPLLAPITPLPTPAQTAPADSVPNLAYTGAKEINVSDKVGKDTLLNISAADTLVGKFLGSKINMYSSQDTNDKIEEFYRKLMISSGWNGFASQSDDTTRVLVYQKASTKLVISVSQIRSTDNFPDELKSQLKVDDRLILTAVGTATEAPPTPVAIPGTPIAAVPAGQKKYAVIELDKGGTVTAELYPEIAPITVENFEKLANRNFYDGLTFHRVEPGFVVQGGDPKGDGTGGPGYNIPGEFADNTKIYQLPEQYKNEAKHVYGSLAMARSSDFNSAGSQFYIVIGQESDAGVASLNGKYAVFGKVTVGMDLVTKIQKGDKIKSIKVSVK